MENYWLEERMKAKKRNRIILLITLLIIIAIIVFKVKSNNKENYYETEAIVTNVGITSLASDKDLYIVSYEYEIDGKKYSNVYQERIGMLCPKEGNQIKIRYNKENYSLSKPNLVYRYIKYIVFIIVCLGVAYIYGMYKNRQNF